jgi:hypothetical protein
MKPIHLFFCAFFFILGLLLGCNGCGNSGSIEVKKTTSDSNVIILPPERSEITQPEIADKKKDKSFPFVTMPVPVIPVPSGNYDSLLNEFNALAAALKEVWRQFDEQKNYTQSFRFKNGVVGFSGSVYQNNLFNLQATLDSVKETTITNTVYEREKKRNQFSLGLGGIYNNDTRILSVGGSVLLKTKNGRMYNAGAYVGTDRTISYKVEAYFPISFRKQ